MEKSEQTAIDRSRKGNGEDKKRSIPKDWNIKKEKGTDIEQNEVYDAEHDVYVFKPTRRNKIKVQISGTTPEISENLLKKIKKKFEEEYPEYLMPKNDVPVAVRFHLHFVYPGPEYRRKYAHAGYYYPSGVDLEAWSEYLFNGLENITYTSKSQIVCTGAECMYSKIPGIVIEQFNLWDLIDRAEYRMK